MFGLRSAKREAEREIERTTKAAQNTLMLLGLIEKVGELLKAQDMLQERRCYLLEMRIEKLEKAEKDE